MPRAKALTPEEADERLAYGLAAGWSIPAGCRHAGRLFRYRQGAHDFVGSKLADAAFRARVDFYRQMIEKDDADLRNVSQQVRCLNRDWLLARLKRLHLMAMGEEPVGIGADGDEVYLPAPNFSAAIRALAEIARVLRLGEEPIEEDDELSRALAEIRAERAGKPVN